MDASFGAGRAPGAVGSARGLGFVWLAAAALAALPLFWFGFTNLVVEWARPQFAHGPLVAAVALAMFVRQARAVAPETAPGPVRWPGAVLALLALALALLGNLIAIDDFVFHAIVLWLAGMVLVVWGLSAGLRFWPPFLLLFFAVPLPQTLYRVVFGPIEAAPAALADLVARLGGAPIVRQGNVLAMGGFEIAARDAFAGLHALVPALVFAGALAILWRGRIDARLALVAVAAAAVLVLSGLRVGLLANVAERAGPEAAEAVERVTGPWPILAVVVLALPLALVVMRRLAGDRRPLRTALAAGRPGPSHAPGAARAPTSRAPVLASRALVVTALVSLATAAAFISMPSRGQAEIKRPPYSLYPFQLGDWVGMRTALEPGVAAILGADDYIAALYHSVAESAPVDFFSAYYLNQNRERGGIHDPQVCLPGNGWTFETATRSELDLTAAGFGTVPINRAIIRRGSDTQLVYYWYEGRGRSIADESIWQLLTKLDTFARRRADGALIRVVTAILPEEPDGAADARLQRFLGVAAPHLRRFVPE